MRQAASSLILLWGLTGCVAYTPLQINDTSRPVADLESVDLLGPVEGTSCNHFILGLAASVEEPLYHAYRNARASAEADALIHVTVDARRLSLFVYSKECVTVRGKAIRYIQ
jgi:hypothetical protein